MYNLHKTAERIKALCDTRGVSINKMLTESGAGARTYYNILSGSYPSTDKALKIANYFDVSVDYLLGISDTKQSKADKNNNKISVPVLGYVAAGIPIEEISDILDYEELSTDDFNPDYNYFGLKIKGDSMQPRIQRGDVVIVRQQNDIENGEIAIVRVNGGEATCKQVKKHSDGITLASFNPAYEPMFFPWSEVESKPISIIGKVVELRAKF